MNILAVVLIVLALILLHGLLAGAELAVSGVRRSRLRELVDEGRAGARSLDSLRRQPDKLHSIVRSGEILIGVAAGAIGGYFLGLALGRAIGVAPALVVTVASTSFLLLLLGELLPRSLALRSTDRWSLWSAGALRVASIVLRPVAWLARLKTNAILWLFGGGGPVSEPRIVPEDLLEYLEDATRAGVIDPSAGSIAARAIDFGELLAAEVMVPRNRVVAIPRDISLDELRGVLVEEGHTRMPIYEDSIDNVIGYLSIKDVIGQAWSERPLVLDELIRPAYFVPETMHAVQLLRQMQLRRISIAVVVEESGGMAGIVTTEDLLEELVGELFSEEESRLPEAIHVNPDRTAQVLGIAPVRDVNRELGLELPEGDGWSTIAGLCIELAGRIPAKGEHLATPGGVMLEVVEASAKRVRAVRIHLPPERGEPDHS